MARRPRRRTLLALALLPGVAIGCLTLGGADPEDAAERAGERYTLTHGEARSAAGCRYAYRLFTPTARTDSADAGERASSDSDRSPNGANVVLAHGFLRDQDTMVGLARALVTAGHRVATLELCNMRPWNGHHRRNAVDMIALADALGFERRRVYAGFSAGALAALLAAAEDPGASGVLTLDLVDQDGLGASAVERIAASDGPTVLALAGPPSACNARGNGRAALALADVPTVLVDGASHCEFESPTNWLCELACGDETPVNASREASTTAARDGANGTDMTDRATDERERLHIIALALEAIATLVADTENRARASAEAGPEPRTL